jgi:hypothetical protein
VTVLQLGQTDSFTIQYDDAFPSAKRRAIALARSVERDAATMCDWFGVTNPLNPGNRATVKVTNNANLGTNYGYQAVWFGTLIEVSPLEGAADQDVADDFARAIFVAEFAEVLMDVRNGMIGHSTWSRKDSAGEALSTICAEMLYEDACLRTGEGYPRGRSWIETSDWPDFISNIDESDQHFVTFGCGILFIAFLMGQEGKTLDQIIQADGQTFEDKFHALTGRSGGYREMTNVLSQFFPKPAPDGALRSDFPFPLRPANERSLALSVSSTIRSSAVIASGQVSVTLPFPCSGTTEADYTVTENTWHLRLTALPTGFANPSYEWYLRPANSGPPIRIDDAGATTSVEWSTVIVDPLNPSAPPPAAEPMPVNVIAGAPQRLPFGDAQALMGVLELDISGGQGAVLGTVECHATDGVRPVVTAVTVISQLHCRQVHVDDTASRDCRDRAFELIAHRLPPFVHQIMLDPPPDLRAAIHVLRELALLTQRASQDGDEELSGALRTVATEALGVPSALLPIVGSSGPRKA